MIIKSVSRANVISGLIKENKMRKLCEVIQINYFQIHLNYENLRAFL